MGCSWGKFPLSICSCPPAAGDCKGDTTLSWGVGLCQGASLQGTAPERELGGEVQQLKAGGER